MKIKDVFSIEPTDWLAEMDRAHPGIQKGRHAAVQTTDGRYREPYKTIVEPDLIKRSKLAPRYMDAHNTSINEGRKRFKEQEKYMTVDEFYRLLTKD